jgi:hypothetical protein
MGPRGDQRARMSAMPITAARAHANAIAARTAKARQRRRLSILSSKASCSLSLMRRHRRRVGKVRSACSMMRQCRRVAGRPERWRAPRTAMTHIAVQEALGGSAVAWLEHVSGKH